MSSRPRNPRKRGDDDEPDEMFDDDDMSAGDSNSGTPGPFDRAIVVEREHAGMPLDRFLSAMFKDLDRAYLRGLVRSGAVRVDGVVVTSPRALWRNAVVTIEASPEQDVVYEKPVVAPEFIIKYEDAALAIIQKPPGEPFDARIAARVCPALVPPRGEVLRLIEKVDRDTSGLVVVTKTLVATRALEAQYEAGTALIEHYAICDGSPEDEVFSIDEPLGSDARRSGRREVNGLGAEPASTLVRVLERFDQFTIVSAAPRTHRTHQVRVHLQSAGIPIVNDPVYGRESEVRVSDLKRGYARKQGSVEKPLLTRMALHIQQIKMDSPAGGVAHATAPPPPDLDRFVKTLERYRRPTRRPGGHDDLI